MAAPTNTTATTAFRHREDLDKMMKLITPTDTPFLNMLSTDDVDNRAPEWATETVRASDADNAALEGDDVTNDAQAAPVIVKNHVQTFDETIGVSDIALLVKTIDGRKEIARQTVNAGKALKLDQEKRFCGNYASVASVGVATAGKSAGAIAWITTNLNKDAGATTGGYNSGTGIVAAHTGGANRAFTATIFKTTIQTAWTNGRGSLTDVLVGAAQKVTMSGFTGVVQATNEVKRSDVTILAAVDVYKSDFGFHRIMASREMLASAALIITPETWKKGVLDSYNVADLAKTGHSTRKLLRTSVTLKCLDEKANAAIINLS